MQGLFLLIQMWTWNSYSHFLHLRYKGSNNRKYILCCCAVMLHSRTWDIFFSLRRREHRRTWLLWKKALLKLALHRDKSKNLASHVFAHSSYFFFTLVPNLFLLPNKRLLFFLSLAAHSPIICASALALHLLDKATFTRYTVALRLTAVWGTKRQQRPEIRANHGSWLPHEATVCITWQYEGRS